MDHAERVEGAGWKTKRAFGSRSIGPRHPRGVNEGTVKITGTGRDETIKLTARKPTDLTRTNLTGFVEGAGYISIDAAHYTAKVDAGQNAFRPVERYGMRSDGPTDVQGLTAGPHMDYQMYVFTPGEAAARLTLGPAPQLRPRPPGAHRGLHGQRGSASPHRGAERLQRQQRQSRLGAIGPRQTHGI